MTYFNKEIISINSGSYPYSCTNPRIRKEYKIFHPHFLRLFFGIPHSAADAMTLVAAFKVEEDLQRNWREERELEDARAREKADPYKPVYYNK
jgi:hypothetical protein